MLGMDSEWTGPDVRRGCRPFMVTAYDGTDEWLWEWDVDPDTRMPCIPRKDIREIRALVDSVDEIVFHSAKGDVEQLYSIGVWGPTRPIPWHKIHDTILSAHVFNTDDWPHRLKELSGYYLGIGYEDELALNEAVVQARRIARKKGWNTATADHPFFPSQRTDLPKLDYWLLRAIAKADKYPANHAWWALASKYGLRDVYRVFYLRRMHKEQLKELGLERQYERELRLMPKVYAMEQRGVTIRRKDVRSEIERYSSSAEYDDNRCRLISRIPNLNVRSTKQLIGVIYQDLQLPIVFTTPKGSPCTDRETLQYLLEQKCPTHSKPYRFLEALLGYRKSRTAATYLESYLRAGVQTSAKGFLTLYPSFNQVGTRFTRFSSSNPNAQNVGKGTGDVGEKEYTLRYVFGPRKGYVWIPIDYDNLELRIFAYSCGDKQLIEAFERGESIHLVIGRKLWGDWLTKEHDEYGWTKNGNFSLIYGASQATADTTYHMKGAYRKIRKEFPLIDEFMQKRIREVRKRGYVTTLGGYRVCVSPSQAYVGTNAFVQGTAGDIAKNAMITCDDWLRSHEIDGHMIMNVHDEIVFEFSSADMDLVRRCVSTICYLMESAGHELGIPTPVSPTIVWKRWSEKEDLVLETVA